MRGGKRVRTLRRATRSAERIAIADNAIREASSEGRGLMPYGSKSFLVGQHTTHAVALFARARGLIRGVVE